MQSRPRWARSTLARDRRGNITTMTALLTPVLFAAAAFAIDQGALYNERREAQRITDLAAIAASADIGNARNVALATFADNGFPSLALVASRPPAGSAPDGWLVVETGSYAADTAKSAGQRFAGGGPEPNAVRLTFGKPGTRYFASALIPPPTISTQATASADKRAAFSVGSRLAALDEGILNAVIGGLTGSSLSLTIMDYEALLDADVELLGFLDALATELDITAGTYDDVLNAKAGIGDIAAALAKAGSGSQAVAAMTHIAGAAAVGSTLPVSRVVDLGPAGRLALGGGSGLTLVAGMMEILTAAASVADGRNQAAIDLSLSAPGLAGLTLKLAIGEPPQSSPWLTVGAKGEIVRTAQTRLLLNAAIGGGGALAGIRINLPLYLELASAEAALARIDCAPAGHRVTVDVRPGIAGLRIAAIDVGDLGHFARNPVVGSAQLVEAPLVGVTGAADMRVGNTMSTPLTFTAREIANAAVKSASTTEIVGSLTGSLLQGLDVDVTVARLDLGLSGLVKAALSTALTAASPVLDQVIGSVLATLGLRLGEADVRVHGLVCRHAVLVQ